MTTDTMKAIKAIIGDAEEIEIGGETFKAYPLPFEEYLKALAMVPEEIEYTDEELKEFEETGKVPNKTGSKEHTIQSLRQQRYVLGIALKRNDPSFKEETLDNNTRLIYAFTPLFVAVMKSTQMSEEIKKKETAEMK